MTVDYSALLYDPVYAALGVDAVFSAGTAGAEVAITVIDDTRAKVETNNLTRAFGDVVETRGVGPGVFARIPELSSKGVVRDEYRGATLTFNGRSWFIYNYDLRGSPNGEDYGEVRFRLRAVEEPTASA